MMRRPSTSSNQIPEADRSALKHGVWRATVLRILGEQPARRRAEVFGLPALSPRRKVDVALGRQIFDLLHPPRSGTARARSSRTVKHHALHTAGSLFPPRTTRRLIRWRQVL